MQINRDSETSFKLEENLTDSLLQNDSNIPNESVRQKSSSSKSHNDGPLSARSHSSSKSSLKPFLSENVVATQQPLQTQILAEQPQTNVVPQPTVRLDSLDVYRGLTMVGMILVDNSGPYPPWWLDHAAWNGLTPADLIFPSFLFIMGMAIPLSTTQKKPVSIRNVIRIAALFLIGVFLNLLARKFTFNHCILQRLSICYAGILLVHFLTNYGEPHKRVFGFIAILSGFLIYISYMVTFDKPDIGCPKQKYIEEFCNFSGWIDRAIFTDMHMIYPNDPEGLFSNLSALVTTYMGYYFCLIMKDNKDQIKKTLKRWAVMCLILGLSVYPMTKMMALNKKIYSASFALLTSASSGATILFMVLVVDILPSKNEKLKKVMNIVTRPFIWLGRNPLFVFIFMDLLAIAMIRLIIVNDKSIWAWFYHYCFSSWIDNKQIASVVFAVFFLLIWTGAAAVLYWRNIFIRL